MPSFRNRIRKFWYRNEDQNTQERRKRMVLAKPSMSSSDITRSQGTSKSASISSVEGLQKVASRTLQSFSDTIRSKARAFYVKSADRNLNSNTENERIPRNQLRRPNVWSSLKSRVSHGSLKSEKSQVDIQNLHSSLPETPISASGNQGTVPEIDIDIPNSPFIDMKDLKDKTKLNRSLDPGISGEELSHRSKHLWPSPLRDTLPQFPIFGMPMQPIQGPPLLLATRRDVSSDFMYESTLFEPIPIASETCSRRKNEQSSDGGFSEYKNHEFPNSEAKAMNGERQNGVPFPVGDYGRINPWREYCHPTLYRAQNFDRDLVVPSSDSDTSCQNVSDGDRKSIVKSKPTQVPSFRRNPSIKDSLRNRLNLDAAKVNKALFDRDQRCSSSNYEADTESIARNPEIQEIGPQGELDNLHIDRCSQTFATNSMVKECQNKDTPEEEPNDHIGIRTNNVSDTKTLFAASRQIYPDDSKNVVLKETISKNIFMGDGAIEASPWPKTKITQCLDVSRNHENDHTGISLGVNSDYEAFDHDVSLESSTRYAIEANERRSGFQIDNIASERTSPQIACHSANAVSGSGYSSDGEFESFGARLPIIKDDAPIDLPINSASLAEVYSGEVLSESRFDRLENSDTEMGYADEKPALQSNDTIPNPIISSSPSSTLTHAGSPQSEYGLSYHISSLLPDPQTSFHSPGLKSHRMTDFSNFIPQDGYDEFSQFDSKENKTKHTPTREDEECLEHVQLGKERETFTNADGFHTKQQAERLFKGFGDFTSTISSSETIRHSIPIEAYDPQRSFNAAKLPQFRFSLLRVTQLPRDGKGSMDRGLSHERQCNTSIGASNNHLQRCLLLSSIYIGNEKIQLHGSRSLPKDIQEDDYWSEDICWTREIEHFGEPGSIIRGKNDENPTTAANKPGMDHRLPFRGLSSDHLMDDSSSNTSSSPEGKY